MLFVVGFFLPVIGLLIAFLATPSSGQPISIVKVTSPEGRGSG